MSETFFTCPAGNPCELATQIDLPCRDFTNVSAIAAPDSLCTRALWEQFRALSVPGPFAESINPDSKREVHKAGLLIELGAHPRVSDREAAGYFSQASGILAQETHNPHSRYPFASDAQLLELFLPEYKGLRINRLPTTEDRTRRQAGIRLIMQAMRRAPIHQEGGIEHLKARNHQLCFDTPNRPKGSLVKLAFLDRCLEAGFNVLPGTGRNRGKVDAYAFGNNQPFPLKLNFDRAAEHTPGIFYFDFMRLMNQICSGPGLNVPHSQQRTFAEDVVDFIGGNEGVDESQLPNLQLAAKRLAELIGKRLNRLLT